MREKITITAEFKQAVMNYKAKNKIKSFSQALLHLAALGLENETGVVSPDPYPGWGGWRGKEASLQALMDYADRVSNGGRDDPAEEGWDEPGEAD